ncbi:MAG: hypothetical protein QOE61_2071 [Micromonosporaceae bacterium]|nr:hypothetical protein [Micromonosporaceae bacterium]
MRQRIILVTAAWLVGAAATATAATAALGALGAGLAGPGSRPMSQADVQRELSAAGPTGSPPALSSGQPSPDASRTPATAPPTSGTRVVPTVGGTIVAQCSGGQVTLVSWIPAQGYRTDGVTPGPANSTWVKFKAGRSELLVTVTCVGDQPKEVIATDDHH